MENSEQRLPAATLQKAIRSGNEFGWREADIPETIEIARKLKLAIVGGQVQYVLPEGTCELYWLSYDATERRPGENWLSFCDRSAREVLDKFSDLVIKTDFDKEAIASFELLREKASQGVAISDFRLFILYFSDTGTDL